MSTWFFIYSYIFLPIFSTFSFDFFMLIPLIYFMLYFSSILFFLSYSIFFIFRFIFHLYFLFHFICRIYLFYLPIPFYQLGLVYLILCFILFSLLYLVYFIPSLISTAFRLSCCIYSVLLHLFVLLYMWRLYTVYLFNFVYFSLFTNFFIFHSSRYYIFQSAANTCFVIFSSLFSRKHIIAWAYYGLASSSFYLTLITETFLPTQTHFPSLRN